MNLSDEQKQIGQVRHLIADLDPNNQIFIDEQLQTYLELNDWDTGNKPGIYRAAADALDAIATTEVLLSKKIRTQDVSTDGPAVAADLSKRAAAFRARADKEEAKAEAEAEASDSFFDVVPFACDNPAEGAEQRGWGW